MLLAVVVAVVVDDDNDVVVDVDDKCLRYVTMRSAAAGSTPVTAHGWNQENKRTKEQEIKRSK